MWHKIASHEVALACASFILLKRWKFFLFVLHLPFFYVGASRVTYNVSGLGVVAVLQHYC
jgi:hypothetical protein